MGTCWCSRSIRRSPIGSRWLPASPAAPIVEGQALASSPFNSLGVLVRGIRAAELMQLPSIANNIRQGTVEGFDDRKGLVIGRRLADQLSAHAGDNVTLVAPRGAVTA